jgi:hypothetical protein
MALTKKAAAAMGLRIVRLLEFDFSLGHPRRPKPKEPQNNIIYSLDELEVSVKVAVPNKSRKPKDVRVCEKTGLPLRPIYYDETVGKLLRAVPVSWREGVPYHEYKRVV